MVSNFALLSNLLLVPAALAVHSSSPVRGPLAPSHETRQSSASNPNNYAGATWRQPKGSFTSITASIEVPDLFGSNGVVLSWIGIDADGTVPCDTGAFFRAGITCSIANGNSLCVPWVQWYPEYDSAFLDLAVNVNDTLTVVLMLSTSTSGEVFIQSQETGHWVSQSYTSSESHALCQATAAWIVSSGSTKGTNSPLAAFGDIMFDSASANAGINDTPYTPNGSTILQMTNPQNHTNPNITFTSILGSMLLVGLV